MSTGKKGLARSIALYVLSALGIAACGREPVHWSDITYPTGSPSSPGLTGSSGTEPVQRGPAIDAATGIAIYDRRACWQSIRLAPVGKTTYAAWWSVRRDSSAALDVSRSDSGAEWTRPVTADSADASRRGCSRPPPAIFADSVSGYVHLAYFIEPTPGAGVFSVHTMDRGASFHAPVPVVFNDHPSQTAIAAEGDRVAVAYDQPLGERSRVFVALSKTAGHLFEIGIPVSAENASASGPGIILRGTKLEVSWTEGSPADTAHKRFATRMGTWK